MSSQDEHTLAGKGQRLKIVESTIDILLGSQTWKARPVTSCMVQMTEMCINAALIVYTSAIAYSYESREDSERFLFAFTRQSNNAIIIQNPSLPILLPNTDQMPLTKPNLIHPTSIIKPIRQHNRSHKRPGINRITHPRTHNLNPARPIRPAHRNKVASSLTIQIHRQ